MLINMFVINPLLNKFISAAFGTWPSGPPPSYRKFGHNLTFFGRSKGILTKSTMANVDERFEVLVFNKYQAKAQNQQNEQLATTWIEMFVINLILNKILFAAFGTPLCPFGTLWKIWDPVWTPSHLLGQCPIFLVFFLFEGIPYVF